MTINSLNPQVLEKICSYLQDADLKAFMKAFEETLQTVQTVAKNELENRDKELERLLSPYEARLTFNISTLKDANLLLLGDQHGNPQYLSDRSALIYFLARRGPVIFIQEGVPSMQKSNASEAGFSGTKRVFQLHPQSLNPTFKENIHSIGWDDQEEFYRLQYGVIDQKYSEIEKSIEDARHSFIQQLPIELRLSDSEWDELCGILFSNHVPGDHIDHYFNYLRFSIELYKLRKTEMQLLGYLDAANIYFTNLDSTKRNPRTEDFEVLVKNYSNEQLEEATREELKVLVENKSGGRKESSNDLIKRHKTITIIHTIITMFERYDEVENLFSSLTKQQTDHLELEKQILKTLSSLVEQWNSIKIGEQQQLNVPIASYSADLPISMVMNKLKFFKMHLPRNLSNESLKELFLNLYKYNAIDLEHLKLTTRKAEDRLAAIDKTFPIRTTSMANTLSKIDDYILSLGLQQSMIVLVAGNDHLINNITSIDYNLTPLYEELNKHKAAILVPPKTAQS